MLCMYVSMYVSIYVCVYVCQFVLFVCQAKSKSHLHVVPDGNNR